MANLMSESNSLIRGLHHVALVVCDLPAAVRFYDAALGIEPWPAAEEAGLLNAGQAWRLGNAGLWLLPAASGACPKRRPVNEAGLAHLCVQTPQIGPVIERCEAAGASLHSSPIDLGTGFLYCYARDPEFNVIEVEGVAPVWPQDRPWLAHANIVTHDLPRLTAFYSGLLAAEAVRSPRWRNDARLDTIADLSGVELRAAWLDAGNAQIELMQYLAPPTSAVTGRREAGAAGLAHLAFEVRDLSQACVCLLDHGGRLQAPLSAGAWRAEGFDPDGNRLQLLDLSAPSRRQAGLDTLDDPWITQRFSAARAALTASS